MNLQRIPFPIQQRRDMVRQHPFHGCETKPLLFLLVTIDCLIITVCIQDIVSLLTT